MTLPNFLIVGAAKSGTTSLWSYLRQHPQVFMSRPKEPNFFAFKDTQPNFKGPADAEAMYQKLHKYSILDFDSYTALFDKVSDEVAIGEASVRYLYFPSSAQLIKEYIPNPKILIMLRNPVDRLFSHYCMNLGMYGLEPLNISESIQQETIRKKEGWGWDWHYVSIGLYHRQVQRYLDLFGHSNIKVILYDDFCADTLLIMSEVYRFLDIDDNFIPDISKRSKAAYLPRSRLIYNTFKESSLLGKLMQRILPSSGSKAIFEGISQINRKSIPSLSSELRIQLTDIFRDDILSLEELIERDLSIWR